MAAGLPTVKVEIEFTAGNWTDVSTSVKMEPGIELHYGRGDLYGINQPGTCSFTLDNAPDATGFSPYTPDSPTTPYYPNIVEGKRVRVTVTKGSAFQRFLGYIDSWQPAGQGASDATVTVSASDSWARIGRIKCQSNATQTFKAYTNGVAGGPTTWDVWPFDEIGINSTLRNLSPLGTPAVATAPSTLLGTLSFASAPQGLLVDGAATLKPGADGTGWVVRCAPQATPKNFTVWFKTTNATAAKQVVLVATTAAGTVLYSIEYAAGSLGLYNSARTLVGTFIANAADGSWWSALLVETSPTTSTQVQVSNLNAGAGTSTFTIAADIKTAANFYLGGYPATLGGGTDGFDGVISAPASAGIVGAAYASANTLSIWATNAGQMLGADFPSLSPSLSVLGNATSAQTFVPDTLGKALTDVITQSSDPGDGASAWVNPATGNVEVRDGTILRPTTVTATITAEADDDGSMLWQRVTDDRPTRVTAQSAIGQYQYVDSTSETAGTPRLDATILSGATTAVRLQVAARDRVVHGATRTQRLKQVTVDLVTAANDLYSALLGGLWPGCRLRVTNLPQPLFGIQGADVYAMGWTERITSTSYFITFDCAPTDDPAEGHWEDATYGRFGTDGVTTAGVLTSSGTTVIITSAGTTFTTAAGSYPLDINLNGERITLTSAPGGAVSPQTFTGVTRGVSPTVARAHSAGETVDVWNAARWTSAIVETT